MFHGRYKLIIIVVVQLLRDFDLLSYQLKYETEHYIDLFNCSCFISKLNYALSVEDYKSLVLIDC